MFSTKTPKQNITHRLKIARGHLDKIVRMVEQDAYCIDVLTQTKAVRSAIEKAEAVLLENHLNHCVVNHVKQGRTQQAVSEVMEVFKKSR